MSFARERVEDAVRGVDAAAAPEAARLDRVLALQQSAGNAAVTALLQRDGATFSPFAPTIPNLNVSPDFVEKQDKATEAKILAFLNQDKPKMTGRIVSGWSIAEFIDLVRQNVPEAQTMAPERVGQIVRAWSPDQQIPDHRKPGDEAGAESELVATIKNTFSKIPTSVDVKKHGLFFTASLSGVEAGIGDKDDGNKLSVSSESGKDVGVNVVVGKTHFAAKVEPGPKSGDPIHWEVNLSFPGDDPMPLMGSLNSLFGSASSSIGHAASDVRAGKASVDSLKEQWAPVKEAVGALSTIADHHIVSLGLKVEGDGPAVSATATLTVTF